MPGEETLPVVSSDGSVPSIPRQQPTVMAAAGQPKAAPAPHPNIARTRWRPWSALGAVSVIMVAAALGAVLAFVVAGRTTTAVHGASSPGVLIAMLAAQTIMVVGTLIAAGLRGDAITSVLALKRPYGGVWAYTGGLVVVLAAVAGYTALTTAFLPHEITDDLAGVADIFRGSWWPLALVVVGLGAPLSEEFMFRGFLLTALSGSWLGYWGATLITTSLWTTLHFGYSSIGLGEVFMIGLVLAVLLRMTGSLRVTVFCHAVYNSGIALIMIFAPSLLGP